MVDPVSITVLVGIICTFLLNLFQSFKSQHFKSECTGGGVKLDYSSKHQTKSND